MFRDGAIRDMVVSGIDDLVCVAREDYGLVVGVLSVEGECFCDDLVVGVGEIEVVG